MTFKIKFSKTNIVFAKPIAARATGSSRRAANKTFISSVPKVKMFVTIAGPAS